MLSGYKTYIAAAISIIAALASYFTGEIMLGMLLQIIVTAVLGALVRSGIAGQTKKQTRKLIAHQTIPTQSAVRQGIAIGQATADSNSTVDAQRLRDIAGQSSK